MRAVLSAMLPLLTAWLIRTNSWRMILPEPIVRCPTSELPICSSGKPTAPPLASIRVWG